MSCSMFLLEILFIFPKFRAFKSVADVNELRE